MSGDPVWIIFDARAISGDTEDATVLESFGKADGVHTDTGAKRYARHEWGDHEFALYRYDLSGKKAENERMILTHAIWRGDK